MRFNRCGLVGVLLTAAAVGNGWNGLWANQGKNFDRLSDEDRAAFSERFTKEVWPEKYSTQKKMSSNGLTDQRSGAVGKYVRGGPLTVLSAASSLPLRR